jgi:hypothetical protein
VTLLGSALAQNERHEPVLPELSSSPELIVST